MLYSGVAAEERGTQEYTIMFQQALEAGKRRDYAKAVELLTRIVSATDRMPQALLYLGRSYHALGELEKAARILDFFVKSCPESAAGHFFLGRSCLALGLYPAAVRHLRESLRLYPSLSQAHGLMGLAYLKARRPERAVDSFRNALALDPKNASLLAGFFNSALVAAIRLFSRGNLDDSARLFNEILAMRPETISAHLYLAAIFRESGKGDLALSHLNAAIAMSPEDPLLHSQKALVLLDQGRKDAAFEELRIGTSGLPSNVRVSGSPEEILRHITIRLFSDGRYKEAIFYALKLLKTTYNDPKLHALVAEAYRNLGDFGRAKNHYTRAMEKDKGSLEIRYGLIAVLWRLEEYEELLSIVRRVLKTNPSDEIALYFRSLALAKVGESPKETAEALQRQIHLKGPDPLLMSALGDTYLKAGVPELAEGWYLRTLKVSKADRRALLSLADIYRSQKKNKREKEIYKRYLGTYPDDRKARRRLTRILLEMESFVDAAEQIVRLLPSEPGNKRLKTVLAMCYRRAGKYSDALLILKDLLRDSPDSEELLKAVVYCLDKLGARNIGIQVIESFMKLHGERLSLVLMLGVLQFHEDAMEKSVQSFRRAISISSRDWKAYRNLGMAYRKMGNKEFAESFLARSEEYRKAAGVHA